RPSAACSFQIPSAVMVTGDVTGNSQPAVSAGDGSAIALPPVKSRTGPAVASGAPWTSISAIAATEPMGARISVTSVTAPRHAGCRKTLRVRRGGLAYKDFCKEHAPSGPEGFSRCSEDTCFDELAIWKGVRHSADHATCART